MSAPGTVPGSVRPAVRGLLDAAVAAYRGTTREAGLVEARAQLDGPLRVAFAGRLKVGKSTLLNALVGERLAATDATECTRVVTSYVHGPATRAWVHPLAGPPEQVRFTRAGGRTLIDLGGRAVEDVARLVVETPNARLEHLTLVDTPGLGSLTTDAGERTRASLLADAPGADAVIYLMRHLHTADVGFLQAFQDDDLASSSPVNALGVLARCDELGGGRLDTFATAERIAAQYRGEPRVRALVQTVVAVSGLLGLAALGLTERHHRALVDLAGRPASLLLSADRLLSDDPPAGDETSDPAAPGSARSRAELVDLLGFVGVRFAVALVRDGRAPDAQTLAAALRRASGLDELRALLLDRFTGRAALLKAQNAVRTVEAALAEDPVAGAGELRRRLDAVVADSHELAELRLLAGLRTGDVDLGDDGLAADAEALLGGDGQDARARLRLTDHPDTDVRAAAVAALRRWQRRGESPVASPAVRRTADVLRRTCEGIVAEARPG